MKKHFTEEGLQMADKLGNENLHNTKGLLHTAQNSNKNRATTERWQACKIIHTSLMGM